MADHCNICDEDVDSVIAHHMAEHGGWQAADAASSSASDLDDDN